MRVGIAAIALLIAGALYDFTGPALAQSPSAETAPNRPDRHEAPDERGDNQGDHSASTGSTDASPPSNQEITGKGEVVDNINADSEYATGRDLEGPPTQFPAAKTPQ